MTFPSKYSSGFSLIELIIVMVIMAVVLGLTGGLVVKSIDQQTKQVELEKVQQTFKQLSYHAFYSGLPAQIQLKENTLIITQGKQEKTIQFEQLNFVPQNYTINAMAAVLPVKFSIENQDTTREFTIKTVYDY